jgi:hypothetical protein
MNLTPTDIRKALLRPHDLQLSSPDAHLLTLRSALLDAWEEETRLYAEGDERWTEAADRGGALARQMVEMRAYTLAGLQAKAIAVAHCQQGGDESRIILDDQQTTDVRLAQSILADLLGCGPR